VELYFALTNALLFQLQRHSDHHAHSFRRYQTLRHHPDSPQLPAGYSTMVLVALVPPLWFRVMDGRIPKYADVLGRSKTGNRGNIVNNTPLMSSVPHNANIAVGYPNFSTNDGSSDGTDAAAQ
jgi:hypothetical protein